MHNVLRVQPGGTSSLEVRDRVPCTEQSDLDVVAGHLDIEFWVEISHAFSFQSCCSETLLSGPEFLISFLPSCLTLEEIGL